MQIPVLVHNIFYSGQIDEETAEGIVMFTAEMCQTNDSTLDSMVKSMNGRALVKVGPSLVGAATWHHSDSAHVPLPGLLSSHKIGMLGRDICPCPSRWVSYWSPARSMSFREASRLAH